MELDIPFRTFVKIFLAALVVYALIQLWGLMTLVFVAILLAVTLEPLVDWLKNHRVPRWASIALVALFMVGCASVFVLVIFPSIFEQMGAVLKDIPKIRDEIVSHIPNGSVIEPGLKRFLRDPPVGKTEELPKHLLTIGGSAMGGISSLFLVMILCLYFLIDGPRAFRWILDFFTADKKEKLEQTGREVSQIIFAYVAGQVITSFFVFVYVLIVLSALKVPAALVLACLASVFDILPLVGFVMSASLAALLALTVSVKTAGLVLVLYVVYNACENYFIVPKIYGNRLKLSTLAVLLSLLVAGSLAGIMGAIIVLPLVASYPIVERIWLKEYLGRRVLEKHADPGV